jgi:hypothetical protein
MQDCLKRRQLVSEWCDALDQLSICVNRLEGCATNSAMFDEQRRIVEVARLRVENARRAVNVHSSENEYEVARILPFSAWRRRSARRTASGASL